MVQILVVYNFFFWWWWVLSDQISSLYFTFFGYPFVEILPMKVASSTVVDSVKVIAWSCTVLLTIENWSKILCAPIVMHVTWKN